MDKFREAYNLPRVNHEETANLNRPRTSNKIESVIKKLPPHRSSDPDGFIGEFYQIFKELIPIPLQLFQKIGEEAEVITIWHHSWFLGLSNFPLAAAAFGEGTKK